MTENVSPAVAALIGALIGGSLTWASSWMTIRAARRERIRDARKVSYTKVSEKHLERYIGEFAGRHNVREQDTIEQMAGVVSGMVGKRVR